MQIAQIVARYTLGGADLLRRAMGKKDPAAMARQRSVFLEGAAQNHIPSEKANEIFDLMEKFAEYGFNKSHSAAYALISYYTAFLKVHYPVEFMAALMTSEMGNQDKLLKYIAVCRELDIRVLQPSVNDSRRAFSAVGGDVVFGLGGIKNVGDEAIREIVEARGEEGPYSSFLDLACRVNTRKVTRRVLESLIKGGACDCFAVSRAGLLASIDSVIARAQKRARDRLSNQISLLSMAPVRDRHTPPGIGFDCPEQQTPELDDAEKLRLEKEALGFFLTSHPLIPFSREIRRLGLKPVEEMFDMPPGSEVSCAILVTSLKEVMTKKGERMAFVGVEDLTGHGEVTFFPRAYADARELLKSEQPLLLQARLDSRSEASPADSDDEEGSMVREIKLLGTGVSSLAEACAGSDAPVSITVPATHTGREAMLALRAVLERYPGTVTAHAVIALDGYHCILRLGDRYRIQPGPELQNALAQWAKEAVPAG